VLPNHAAYRSSGRRRRMLTPEHHGRSGAGRGCIASSSCSSPWCAPSSRGSRSSQSPSTRCGAERTLHRGLDAGGAGPRRPATGRSAPRGGCRPPCSGRASPRARSHRSARRVLRVRVRIPRMRLHGAPDGGRVRRRSTGRDRGEGPRERGYERIVPGRGRGPVTRAGTRRDSPSSSSCRRRRKCRPACGSASGSKR